MVTVSGAKQGRSRGAGRCFAGLVCLGRFHLTMQLGVMTVLLVRTVDPTTAASVRSVVPGRLPSLWDSVRALHAQKDPFPTKTGRNHALSACMDSMQRVDRAR